MSQWGCSTGANPTTDFTTLGSVNRIRDQKSKSRKNRAKKISPPQQEVVHPGLSGSTSRSDIGSGCFSP